MTIDSISIGRIFMKYTLIPTVSLLLLFVTKYILKGFIVSYRFYRSNDRFMNEEEKQGWLNKYR